MGLKWPRYDIGHLPPSSAKFKNEWIYISTPSVCLNGVDRYNFIEYGNSEYCM